MRPISDQGLVWYSDSTNNINKLQSINARAQRISRANWQQVTVLFYSQMNLLHRSL